MALLEGDPKFVRDKFLDHWKQALRSAYQAGGFGQRLGELTGHGIVVRTVHAVAASGGGPNSSVLCSAPASRKMRIQFSRVRNCQICIDQSSAPLWCSSTKRRTASGRNKPRFRIFVSERRSSTISRRSFASQ